MRAGLARLKTCGRLIGIKPRHRQQRQVCAMHHILSRAERVFIAAPHLSAEGIKDKGKPTRVDFALK
jgi:hypothetical protein